MTTDTDLYALAERLFPLKRTVQGHAVIQTFREIENFMLRPMRWTDVPIGTKVFDWEVLPDAKNRRAYHPTLDEVPAYDGPLTYDEAIIPGELPQEVLLSTYTCHPSMANDNVSGMVVTAALAKWIASHPRRYTYRVLFAPETIGALCWLNEQSKQHCTNCHDAGETYGLDALRRRIIAGYTINNCGDERAWSFIPSRKGETLADRAARHVLRRFVGPVHAPWHAGHFAFFPHATEYSFADRGSDERQFCAPGVDLPVASVMRSKHGTYPEYHTPADDLSIISPKGLGDTYRCYQRILETIEQNRTYRVTTIGEPMLSKHGLYPTGTIGGPQEAAKIARDLCAYSDGQTDLIAIADATNRPVWELAPIAQQLSAKGLLR